MRTIFILVIFLLVNLFTKAQLPVAPRDTTVIVNAKATLRLVSPQNGRWTHMPNSNCLSFEYPNPYTIVLTSKCDEAQKVTLKREMVIPEGEPLLDVPRSKE